MIHALALTLLAAAPAEQAGPATLLVTPFAQKGEAAPEWTGVAIAESVVDFVAQVNHDNFLTLKQLDAVLRPRDLKLTDADKIEAVARDLAKSLGATDVITGDLEKKGDIYSVTARRISVASGEQLKASKVSGTRSQLPILIKKLAQELLSASTKAPPLSKSQQALEEAAACTGMLARQSLSPTARGTLDEAAVADAEKHCKAALEEDPQLGLARAGLAVALACRGQLDDAKAEAQKARAKRFVPLAVLAESFALRRSGDAQGARGVLDDAVAQRPGFLHALGYLGEERLDSHDNASAKVEFERYLKRAPGHPWAQAMLGHALARLGKKEEGLHLTQEAIAKSPGDPEISIELASRLIDLGKDDEAEPFLKTAMDAKPPRTLAGLRLGFLQYKKKRFKEARGSFERVVQAATRTDESRVRAVAQADLALVAAQEGNLEEAVQHLGAARDEGMKKLPCQDPAFAAFQGKPELAEACKEVESSKPGVEPFDENDAVSVDF